MEEQEISFNSPEDLAILLEQVGMRLHAKNRISGSESVYYWHLAEVIRKAGLLARLAGTDLAMMVSFGDGYEAGTIPEEQKEDKFLELLKEQRP